MCKDAIRFEVWGEIDDVEEMPSEAVDVQRPPEVFDFTLAHDIHTIADGKRVALACPLELQLGYSARPRHAAVRGERHTLLLSIDQADALYRVRCVDHVYLGHVRDESGKVMDAEWLPLPILEQSRHGPAEAWMVHCELVLPSAIQERKSIGRTVLVDVRAEVCPQQCGPCPNSASKGLKRLLVAYPQVIEADRLILDEPLVLTWTLTLRIDSTPASGSIMLEPTSSLVESRLRATSAAHQVYVGAFEASDAAIDRVMAALGEHTDDGAGDILMQHETQLASLTKAMANECARQFEDLARAAAPLGLVLAPALKLWQLPPEAICAAEDALPSDVESLQRMVLELRAQLKQVAVT